MSSTTAIVSLIDGSIYSRSICEHTAWVANRMDAAVTVVHALGRRQVSSAPADLSGNIGLGARTALLEELADFDRDKAKLAKKRGRAILADAKEMLAAAGVNEIDAMLRHSEIVETVLELEQNAELVVIGKRGEGADFDRLHLGSNLERVVRSSTKPVLVTSREFKPIKRVLIAFDAGSSVLKAVNYFAGTTAFTDLECHLLTAGAETKENRRQIEGADATLQQSGFTVTHQIEAGQPDEVISAAVDNDGYDLLLMGAYGHSRIRNLIIGSTTTEMVRSCMIPVLLFR